MNPFVASFVLLLVAFGTGCGDTVVIEGENSAPVTALDERFCSPQGESLGLLLEAVPSTELHFSCFSQERNESKNVSLPRVFLAPGWPVTIQGEDSPFLEFRFTLDGEVLPDGVGYSCGVRDREFLLNISHSGMFTGTPNSSTGINHSSVEIFPGETFTLTGELRGFLAEGEGQPRLRSDPVLVNHIGSQSLRPDDNLDENFCSSLIRSSELTVVVTTRQAVETCGSLAAPIRPQRLTAALLPGSILEILGGPSFVTIRVGHEGKVLTRDGLESCGIIDPMLSLDVIEYEEGVEVRSSGIHSKEISPNLRQTIPSANRSFSVTASLSGRVNGKTKFWGTSEHIMR